MTKNDTIKKGFTIIELLVVMAIIMMLSTIVLASVSAAKTKARDIERISELYQLRTAVALYALENRGNYPYIGSNCNIQVALPGQVSYVGCSITSLTWNGPANSFRNALVPKYISRLPSDPLNNLENHYTYTIYTSNTSGTLALTSTVLDYNITGYLEEAGNARSCEKRISIPVKQQLNNSDFVPRDWCNVSVGGANFLRLFIDH